MQKTIHTPGPWSVNEEIQDGYFRSIHAENWGSLATVVVKVMGDSHLAHKSIEGEANARLIASAPDLLYWLETALATMPSYYLPILQKNIRAAIAKATASEGAV